jgi:TonB family protein
MRSAVGGAGHLLSTSKSRRRLAAIASVALNASFVLIALLPSGPSGPQAEYPEEQDHALKVSFLKPRAPRDRPPAQRTGDARSHTRPANHGQPIPPGPPTETPQSLRARMNAEADPRASADLRPYSCSSLTDEDATRGERVATLAIHIGLDGRVVEAEVERSSGDARTDRELQRCASDWGPFPLAIVDGRVIESWQRVNWPQAHAISSP